MRAHEIVNELQGAKDVRSLRIDKLINFLKEKGFTPFSGGEFSYVYERGNEIVKLYFDEHYDRFVALCKAHPENPHFPKFKGNSVKVGDGIRMIRIEKLDDATPAMLRMTYDFEKKIERGLQPDMEMTPYEESFFNALLLVYKNNSKASFIDIGIGNLMRRGNTPVILDPYAANNAHGWASDYGWLGD